TVLFGGMLVLGPVCLGSIAWIVRGKWLCLMSAPERYHAKWLMFGSILCILVGPTLNIASAFITVDKEQSARMSMANKDLAALVKQMEGYKKGTKALSSRACIQLVGDFA